MKPLAMSILYRTRLLLDTFNDVVKITSFKMNILYMIQDVLLRNTLNIDSMYNRDINDLHDRISMLIADNCVKYGWESLYVQRVKQYEGYDD